MKRTLLLAAPFFAFTLVVSCFIASEACAETKPRKPTVCENFTETTVADKASPTGRRKIGICYDSKRPRVFTYWQAVTVDNGNGPHKYVVGG